ncbi:MAG: DUF6293 family protein [Candidatus Altiarchaeota archaeon]
MTIMFVPVGEQIKPIYEGFKYVKNVDKVYLLASKKTIGYASEVSEKIGEIYNTEILDVTPEELDNVICKLIEVAEKHKKDKVVSNVTGGTKIMSLSCYILCSYLGGDAFYIFKTDEGKMRYIEMPVLKIKLNSIIEEKSTRSRILEKLMEREYSSLTSLAKELRIKNSTLSALLDDLSEQGLIKLKREGRKLKIEISKTGKIIYKIRKFKNE